MLPDISTYIILASLILGMNIIPAFMPPTWTVLAFFYIHYHLNLIAVVLIGGTFATCGRIVLYTLSKNQLRRFFGKSYLSNYDALGDYLQHHKKLSVPIIIAYSFLPLPSNELFVIAGLTRISLKVIAISFLVGGLISDTFWISAASFAHEKLSAIFSREVSNGISVAIELLGIALIIMVGRIEWAKILPKAITKKL